MILQASSPASQLTVNVQAMSVRTEKTPTDKSAKKMPIKYMGLVMGSIKSLSGSTPQKWENSFKSQNCSLGPVYRHGKLESLPPADLHFQISAS